MLRLSWQIGSSDGKAGPILWSATRFTYRRLVDMPGVFLHGLGLRRSWPEIEGAIGVFLAGDLFRRTTYTVSAWTDDASLRRWLRSPAHAQLVRRYLSRMQSSTVVTWQVARLRVRGTFAEGLARLAEADAAQAASRGVPGVLSRPAR
jgi:hypothetical protein